MASYFMPSFFQKRLLKYALSRLGLVDTEALDPDNLGICWGQRSTIELRDIGLKLEVSDAPSAGGGARDHQTRPMV
jgi:autophagy-related protein 2